MLYDLKYTNEKGQTIVFKGDEVVFRDTVASSDKLVNATNPYSLIKFEGFGEVGTNLQTQRSPYQDGSIAVDSVLNERYPYLEFVIRANEYKSLAEYRKHATRVFNPKIPGTFELGQGSDKYLIDAYPENAPLYPDEELDALGRLQRVLVFLVSPNPYWRSPNQESQPLQAYVGNFKLPMTFPFELGTSGSRTTLYNDGDSPAPVQIEINGPITNPQIFNRTTGEFIRVNRSISEGEKIVIDTESGQKKVVVVSADGTESQAFGYLDADSTLFNLEIGENEIEHVADSGNRHAKVIVRWQNRYVGV